MQAELTLTTENKISSDDLSIEFGEPRVQDLRIAEALGFITPVSIRKLIRRHMNELKRFGEVISIWKKPTSKGGRPGTEYWLNEEQVLYITAKSDTPRSADVTVEMVRVFRAFLAGRLKPAGVSVTPRKPSNAAEIAKLCHEFEESSKLERELGAMLHANCLEILEEEKGSTEINSIALRGLGLSDAMELVKARTKETFKVLAATVPTDIEALALKARTAAHTFTLNDVIVNDVLTLFSDHEYLLPAA